MFQVRQSIYEALTTPHQVDTFSTQELNPIIAELDVSAVALDGDGALAAHGATELSQESVETVRNFQELGLRVCLISNNPHRSVSLARAEQLNISDVSVCVNKTSALLGFCMRERVNPQHCALIGDRKSDVLFAKLAGSHAIRVVGGLGETTFDTYIGNPINKFGKYLLGVS